MHWSTGTSHTGALLRVCGICISQFSFGFSLLELLLASVGTLIWLFFVAASCFILLCFCIHLSLCWLSTCTCTLYPATNICKVFEMTFDLPGWRHTCSTSNHYQISSYQTILLSDRLCQVDNISGLSQSCPSTMLLLRGLEWAPWFPFHDDNDDTSSTNYSNFPTLSRIDFKSEVEFSDFKLAKMAGDHTSIARYMYM